MYVELENSRTLHLSLTVKDTVQDAFIVLIDSWILPTIESFLIKHVHTYAETVPEKTLGALVKNNFCSLHVVIIFKLIICTPIKSRLYELVT